MHRGQAWGHSTAQGAGGELGGVGGITRGEGTGTWPGLGSLHGSGARA